MKKRNVIYLLVLFVLCVVAFSATDKLLKTEVTPYGIVSYEFISTVENSNKALQLWGEDGKAAAGFSLGLDYLFILVYSALLIHFLLSTSRKLSATNPMTSKAISTLAGIFPIAALCDAVENYGLLRLLFGSQNQFWADIAWYGASIKFAIIGLSIVAILTGQLLAFIGRAKSL